MVRFGFLGAVLRKKPRFQYGSVLKLDFIYQHNPTLLYIAYYMRAINYESLLFIHFCITSNYLCITY